MTKSPFKIGMLRLVVGFAWGSLAPALLAGVTAIPKRAVLTSGAECKFRVSNDEEQGPQEWKWDLMEAGGGTLTGRSDGTCTYTAPDVNQGTWMTLRATLAGASGVQVLIPIQVVPPIAMVESENVECPTEAEPGLRRESAPPGLAEPQERVLKTPTRKRQGAPDPSEEPSARRSRTDEKVAIPKPLPGDKSPSASALALSWEDLSSSGASARSTSPLSYSSSSSSSGQTTPSIPGTSSRHSDGDPDEAGENAPSGRKLRLSLTKDPLGLHRVKGSKGRLGKGAFGAVHMLATKEGHPEAARKTFEDPKAGSTEDPREREISILKSLNHRNIIQYKGDYFREGKRHLVMDLMADSLYARKKDGQMEESKIREILEQLLEGLAYLHEEKGIVHGDLKTANILIDATECVKIADFGSARHFDKENTHARVPVTGNDHTLLWAGPEFYGQGGELGYRESADIWALGCVIVEMLSGGAPWQEWTVKEGMSQDQLGIKIAKGKISPQIPERASRDLKDFLGKCFEINPDDRPSARMLSNHAFLKNR